MWHASLFLALPAERKKCMASKCAQCSARGRFWIFKIPCEVGVLKGSQTTTVELYFPYDNIACTHSWNERMRLHVLDVYRKLWSKLWSLVQAHWLTKEYQAYQWVPNIDISGKPKSILLTFLPRIFFLLPWMDGRQYKEWKLCTIVVLFCSISHNSVLHISWHDLPYRRTT